MMDLDFLEKDQLEFDGIVKNKKSKPIRIKKQNGRLRIYNGQKSVGGERALIGRLKEMKMEVNTAEAGKTVSVMKDLGSKGTSYKRYGVKSTFPKWFGRIGFNSKKDFNKVYNRKSGERYQRLVRKAHKDLSQGYDTSFGEVPPDTDYLVKTRQRFDNRGVIFRRINGKVVPLRVKGRNRNQLKFDDEVPF